MTLRELAHEVGANDYNQRKHFKLVYGQTVFGFLHDYKMEIAKAILLDPTIKISDLSEQLGYKHATRFSVTFKKHFRHLLTVTR
jgi:AraC-like DNA-binding protein